MSQRMLSSMVLPTQKAPSPGSSPLVSVILPTYNRHHLVGRGIGSVLEQTYPNVELIVVDDGSTDGTGDWVREQFPAVRYAWQPNGGDASARNRGLELATGQLVAFQDDDDQWHPAKLARQVALLAGRPEVGLVCTSNRTVDQTGQVVRRRWKTLHEGRVTEPLFQSVFVYTASVVMRRSVVEQVGRFDTSLPLASDYEFFLRASLATEFAAIDEPLVTRQRWPGSLTKTRALQGALAKLRALARLYDRPEVRALVRPKIARRRLARLAFDAGRKLNAVGDHSAARSHFARSLRYRPSLRTAWSWLRAAS
jgi:glycosyltransferase involved in cell wall biosynthesis